MDAPSMDFGGLLPVVALHLFRGHERGRILSGQSVAPRSRLGVHAGDMPRAESATSAVSSQPCRPASRRRAAYRPGKRSEEHTSEIPSIMRNSYAVFCLK